MIEELLNSLSLVEWRFSDDDARSTELTEQAIKLFNTQRIHLHSNYDEAIGLVDRDGQLQAVLVVALTEFDVGDDDEEVNSVEFSIATAPTAHRKGLAERLTRHLINVTVPQWAEEFGWDERLPTVVEAFVANPVAVIPLLQKLGFEPMKRKGYWAKRVES